MALGMAPVRPRHQGTKPPLITSDIYAFALPPGMGLSHNERHLLIAVIAMRLAEGHASSDPTQPMKTNENQSKWNHCFRNSARDCLKTSGLLLSKFQHY